MIKMFIMIGSLKMLAAVALGAFGAHGLKERLSPNFMEIYQTAVQYHMIHALAILFTGLLMYWLGPLPLLSWAGWSFIVGVLIFSGSLYMLSTTGLTKLGAITPIGGGAFLVGWLLIALAAWRHIV
jgi:uncharacterized membrane protein YgdD (TMEM256/DUF423 family)